MESEGRREGKRGGERAFASASWPSRVRPSSLTVMPLRAHRRAAAAAYEGSRLRRRRRFLAPGSAWVRYTECLRRLLHNLRVVDIFFTKPRLELTLRQRQARRGKATKREKERRKEGRRKLVVEALRGGRERGRTRESRAGSTSRCRRRQARRPSPAPAGILAT